MLAKSQSRSADLNPTGINLRSSISNLNGLRFRCVSEASDRKRFEKKKLKITKKKNSFAKTLSLCMTAVVRCNICHKLSSKGEHQCIVCDTVYRTVQDLENHQFSRQHLGGHNKSSGPLAARNARRTGVDEEEEQLNLPTLSDADGDPEVDDERIDLEKDSEDIERRPPPRKRIGTIGLDFFVRVFWFLLFVRLFNYLHFYCLLFLVY